MRYGLHLLALSTLLILPACGMTDEEKAMKAKCESLVKQKATTNAVILAFGASPKDTFTRSKALEQLQHQNEETWKKSSQHPLTYLFRMYSGDVLMFFDDDGTAVGYYLSIQL